MYQYKCWKKTDTEELIQRDYAASNCVEAALYFFRDTNTMPDGVERVNAYDYPAYQLVYHEQKVYKTAYEDLRRTMEKAVINLRSVSAEAEDV